jgi:hypothetical protein
MSDPLRICPFRVTMNLNIAEPWPAEVIIGYTGANCDVMTTMGSGALHPSCFTSLMAFLVHQDTQGTQAAACSAILHQSLASVPGSWQPLQASCVMQLIYSIAGAPCHTLLMIADAFSIMNQAIRDAARLGIGPVILQSEAVSAAELYREPLVVVLKLFVDWAAAIAGSRNALTVLTISRDKALLESARGAAYTAALQLVGSYGVILVEQGRLTRTEAAEVLAAAH